MMEPDKTGGGRGAEAGKPEGGRGAEAGITDEARGAETETAQDSRGVEAGKPEGERGAEAKAGIADEARGAETETAQDSRGAEAGKPEGGRGAEAKAGIADEARGAARRKTVDLIVPCFNEEKSLRPFFEAAQKETAAMQGYAFRFIFIDDGSGDGTLATISEFSRDNENVDYISFSRNFGKEAGIYAGLRNSTADYAAVIDADLQHPPSMLREMLRAVDEEGYDSCSARRVSREGEPRIQSFFARSFYKLINRISDVDIVDGAVDYRMMSRQMVRAIMQLSEVQRFSKGIFAWVGFRTKWIEFRNVERIAGETKFSFWKLFKYAIEGITAFTTVPLRFASFAGLTISLLSFVLLFYELIKTLVFGIGVPGYPSMLIMILLIGGISILSCGILGEYVARMYMETKRRPIYIEKDTSLRRDGRAPDGGCECGGESGGSEQ